MKFLKQNKKVIISLFFIVAALLFTYFFCDESTDFGKNTANNSEISEKSLEALPIENAEQNFQSEYIKDENVFENKVTTDLNESEKINNETEAFGTNAAESKPKVEKEENVANVEKNISEICSENVTTEEENIVSDKKTEEKIKNSTENVVENEKSTQSEKKYCTLLVECKNALGKNSEKEEILPPDGIIFPLQRVELEDGDSVFDILLREMKNHKIHLEFVNTPIFNSTYIEGIGNLYEFDCGDLSGWLYSVNGVFPDYGCSLYKPEDGDEICWIYTCDLGKDAGAEYFTNNGRVE